MFHRRAAPSHDSSSEETTGRKKNMKKLFCGLLFAVAMIAPVLSFAGPPGQMASEFGTIVSKNKTAAVVAVKVGEIQRPLGLRYNLDALTFAGVSDVAVGGFAAVANVPLAANVTLRVGPGLNVSTGQRPIPCAYFSMSWRL